MKSSDCIKKQSTNHKRQTMTLSQQGTNKCFTFHPQSHGKEEQATLKIILYILSFLHVIQEEGLYM